MFAVPQAILFYYLIISLASRRFSSPNVQGNPEDQYLSLQKHMLLRKEEISLHFTPYIWYQKNVMYKQT